MARMTIALMFMFFASAFSLCVCSDYLSLDAYDLRILFPSQNLQSPLHSAGLHEAFGFARESVIISSIAGVMTSLSSSAKISSGRYSVLSPELDR
ncbi:MAG: hypothetical protein AB7E75_02915 [Candidatus Methanomethylophilaceae archaeon]